MHTAKRCFRKVCVEPENCPWFSGVVKTVSFQIDSRELATVCGLSWKPIVSFNAIWGPCRWWPPLWNSGVWDSSVLASAKDLVTHESQSWLNQPHGRQLRQTSNSQHHIGNCCSTRHHCGCTVELVGMAQLWPSIEWQHCLTLLEMRSKCDKHSSRASVFQTINLWKSETFEWRYEMFTQQVPSTQLVRLDLGELGVPPWGRSN